MVYVLSPDFALLGGLLSIGGDVAYIRDTLGGRTLPNRVSWLLWGIATSLVGVAQIREGVDLQWLLSLGIGLGDFFVFAASFRGRHGVWELTAFDVACGIASAVGLLVWARTSNNSVALFSFILADALACIPTITKSWKAPHTETTSTYLFTMMAAIITLLTAKQWSSGAVAFPLWIAAINLLFVVLVVRQHRPTSRRQAPHE